MAARARRPTSSSPSGTRPAFDQPLQGWFGHADPFRFEDGFAKAPGIRAALCSTPPMLSLLAFEAALDAFDGIEMLDLAAKGRALCDLFIALVDEKLARFGVTLATPRDGARRGNHVSLRHPEAFGIVRALIARGIVGDFRAPDAMRFGFAPLYIRFVDIYDAVAAMEEVIGAQAWHDLAPLEAGAVT
jgi:kynureninase